MKTNKLLAVLTLLGAVTVLPACEEEGPFEEAGEEIDQAANELGDSLEEACEEISQENC